MEAPRSPNGKSYEVIAGIQPELARNPHRASLLSLARSAIEADGMLITENEVGLSFLINALPSIPFEIKPQDIDAYCQGYMASMRNRVDQILRSIVVPGNIAETIGTISVRRRGDFPGFVGTRIVGGKINADTSVTTVPIASETHIAIADTTSMAPAESLIVCTHDGTGAPREPLFASVAHHDLPASTNGTVFVASTLEIAKETQHSAE